MKLFGNKTVLCALIVCLSTVAIHACPPPKTHAHLVINPYVIVGKSILLDGSTSHAHDECYIVKYEWDWNGDNVYEYAENSTVFPDGAGDGRVWHTFTGTGTFTVTVNLRVTDSFGQIVTDTQTVHVSPDTDNDGLPDEWELAYFQAFNFQSH